MSQDGVEFTAGESGSDWPCEEPESLSSSDKQIECTETNLRQRKVIEVTRDAPKATIAVDLTDFHRLLESTIAAVTESNKALQDSIEASNAKFQESLRAEIRTEIETALKKSTIESQRLNNEFFDRLHAETSKCNQLISQVQNEKEAELVAVNNKIKSMSVELETELDSKVEMVDREVRQVKAALKENNEQITIQQRENVEPMNQRTN
jgi:hypothetical protein